MLKRVKIYFYPKSNRIDSTLVVFRQKFTKSYPETLPHFEMVSFSSLFIEHKFKNSIFPNANLPTIR